MGSKGHKVHHHRGKTTWRIECKSWHIANREHSNAGHHGTSKEQLPIMGKERERYKRRRRGTQGGLHAYAVRSSHNGSAATHRDEGLQAPRLGLIHTWAWRW
jgi:hypothetical protein